MVKAEVEQRFPEAAAFARLMRETFGDQVRLIYAKNAKGETLGRPSGPSTNGNVSALAQRADSII